MGSNDSTLFDHHDLQGRVLSRMKSSDTQGRLIRMLKNQFLTAMAEEVNVMDRNQRKKLFADVVRTLFEEILGGFKAGTE